MTVEQEMGTKILGLHFHAMKKKVQTIQYRKSRIWEMKEDEYTKSLDKNEVCAIFQKRDIRKNVLSKFIKLCMETPCGHRKPTETSVFEFFY